MASIQQTTSLIKFDHLDEKSEEDSISNLSTKVDADRDDSVDEEDFVAALAVVRHGTDKAKLAFGYGCLFFPAMGPEPGPA